MKNKRGYIINLLLIINFSFCQNEKEPLFGKSKDEKKKERECNPVLTFFICESYCINTPNYIENCETAKGSCYIQRNNICTGSTDM
ncbi:hypothetical protein AB3N62_10905 [Leptospira sp. WS4.C2]